MTTRCALAGWLLSVSIVLSGCNPPKQGLHYIDVVPASGILTFQGEPLQQHEVTFYPEDGSRVAVGLSDAEGRFTLGTNRVGDGAAPGKCKVTVKFRRVTDDDVQHLESFSDSGMLRDPKVRLNPKYSNPDQSGLTVEIPEGGSTELKIDLE